MSIKKNYLYYLTNQLIIIILPLITVPYVSRVLEPKGVGVFAYTSSIVQYFIILGMLGIGTYGNRSIAIVRDNRKELSKTFLSIYALQVVMSFISLLIYVLLVFYGFQENKKIALLQIISLLASVIDVTWFFSGLESFKKIVTRNLIVRIISLAAIFIFVKTSEDLMVYTFIMCLSTFLGQLIMWLNIREFIDIVPIRLSFITQHLKPAASYFAPQMAIQIYFILDKTMIGILSNKVEVGIYEYADRLFKVSLAFVTSLGAVMLPRISNTFSKGDFTKVKSYLFKSLEFSTLIAVPIMFGLCGIANEFIPWYLGPGFIKSKYVLLIISPAIFFMAWSGVFGTQFMLPTGKIKQYTISVYIGAIINLIINLILIKEFGSLGAAIGTLSAEFSVMGTQIFLIRKDFKIRPILPKAFDCFIAGFIMFGVVRILGNLLGISIITTFTQIIVGFLTYILFILIIEWIRKDGILLNEVHKIRLSKFYKKLIR